MTRFKATQVLTFNDIADSATLGSPNQCWRNEG